jgi:hypothetical protein
MPDSEPSQLRLEHFPSEQPRVPGLAAGPPGAACRAASDRLRMRSI